MIEFPRYREDIVWLRGIAVLLVVVFHFGAPVRGGFVGVDVFFVISGFLITQIISADVRDGTFSLIAFYQRRARRIIPALYAMLAATLPLSLLFLLPCELDSYRQSLIGALTFASNFIFWTQSGYFDTAAVAKPLLHTWSLAVEEQFYLVFPIIFVLLARRFNRPALLISLVALGDDIRLHST